MSVCVDLRCEEPRPPAPPSRTGYLLDHHSHSEQSELGRSENEGYAQFAKNLGNVGFQHEQILNVSRTCFPRQRRAPIFLEQGF